ncbi:MAG: beta-lactamase family protein [Asgard group archaeon]|nr:beta-lactamase family protein [Asgard group archaeon]
MNPLEEKLQDFVRNTVDKNKYIFNFLLTLSTGNKEFNWSGAEGVISREQRIIATPTTPFFIASITKLFTATTIMKLYEEKKINLEDKIVDYLPESLVKGLHIFKGVDYTETITIRHLLSHTSGIADYFLEKPKDGKSYFKMVLENPEKEITIDQTITIAREKLQPNFVPGNRAKYSDTNFQLLGRIIESVEKKELHDVYLDKIFTPLEMKNTWLYRMSEPIEKSKEPVAEIYYNNDVISSSKPFYAAWADGGLISTTNDSLVFLRALFNGEILDKEKTLTLMHHWRSIGFPLKYGLGTMYIEFPAVMTMFRKLPGLTGHLGSTGTFLLYAEDIDLYLAGAINQANSPSKAVMIVLELLRKIGKEF